MLADSVEASSPTLTDPTPARIKSHIDTIIKGIFSEGQLDESELTFKDLHYLSENFQRILTGIFHQRIAYPDAKIRDVAKAAGRPEGRAEGKGGQPATSAAAPAGQTRQHSRASADSVASGSLSGGPVAADAGRVAEAPGALLAAAGEHAPGLREAPDAAGMPAAEKPAVTDTTEEDGPVAGISRNGPSGNGTR